jgi:beta-lactamase superfamily II metal-dependent hydrolase
MGKLHLLDVGCGDASVISTGKATFLIDCHCIGEFAKYLPSSKKIRGVFITHQHEDHYSGLSYLYDNGYKIDFLVTSPYKRRYNDQSVLADDWKTFNDLVGRFEKRGTEVRKPYRQSSFDKAWWETGQGARFWIIGPHKCIATDEERELHDACLVVKADFGKRHCLFAGDASDKNLNRIAGSTNNYCNDILHASHHGSINGADLEFVKGCNARYSVVSTEAGVFSNVPHSTALGRYKNHTSRKVYRTDNDGTLTFSF